MGAVVGLAGGWLSSKAVRAGWMSGLYRKTGGIGGNETVSLAVITTVFLSVFVRGLQQALEVSGMPA
ncbi:hypothetical protein [Methanosarcina horonobensis]|uniref:hypothetical protein n=1 Tax=Methanosarcina horonobensis TaxID=418008 RepID=UPI001EF60D34|nr:hypothetical protein [Methanosarcina horonobensis]